MGADEVVGGASAYAEAGSRVGLKAEVDGLGGHHGFEGEHAGGVGDDGAGVAGGDWTHADVVFGVGGGGDGVHAGGVGERFVLGGEGGGGVLDHHEAAVERRHARSGKAGRRPPMRAMSTRRACRRSLMLARPQTAMPRKSAATERGAPWKLPPERTDGVHCYLAIPAIAPKIERVVVGAV